MRIPFLTPQTQDPVEGRADEMWLNQRLSICRTVRRYLHYYFNCMITLKRQYMLALSIISIPSFFIR